ncbi:Type IV fimbrial biogenesis protein PilV, partial [Pseudomonas fluorescens]
DADRGAGRVADSHGRLAWRGGSATQCAEVHRQLADDQPGQFHRLRHDGPHPRQFRRRLHRHAADLGQSFGRAGSGPLRFHHQHRQFRWPDCHRQHHPQSARVHHHHHLERRTGSQHRECCAQLRPQQPRGGRSGGVAM